MDSQQEKPTMETVKESIRLTDLLKVELCGPVKDQISHIQVCIPNIVEFAPCTPACRPDQFCKPDVASDPAASRMLHADPAASRMLHADPAASRILLDGDRT